MVNNIVKIKNLFIKPKIRSMYSIKLINESFPKTLPRWFQGLIVRRKRGGSLWWHPSSSFMFLLVKLRRHQMITPSMVFTQTRNTKARWSARTLLSHNKNSLIFFSQKMKKEGVRKIALRKVSHSQLSLMKP